MHADRNLRIDFGDRIHHVLEHDVVGVGPRAARGLDDDRRIEAGGGVHDGERLLHVVDVEGRHAVVVFRRVVEQLTQRDPSHVSVLRVGASMPDPASLAYPQNLDARQGFAFHPFKKRAARGRNIAEIAGHAGLVQRRHGVAAAGDRDQLLGPGPLAACLAATMVPRSNGVISKAPSGPFQTSVAASSIAA